MRNISGRRGRTIGYCRSTYDGINNAMHVDLMLDKGRFATEIPQAAVVTTLETTIVAVCIAVAS